MRKFYLLLLSTAIFTNSNAQSVDVIATSGTLSGSYPTLKGAFDKINNGTHKGTITINVIGNTTETASAMLNASGAGSASYTTINIQPLDGARIISGSLAAPLIDLSGADNVTIDGLNTGSNSLTISNVSTNNQTSTSAIRFIGDATNNTVTNCTISGSETGILSGTILFTTGTSTGNDGNIITNNIITSAGGNLPFNAIYSVGSSTVIDNSGIAITNNSIQDYYNPIGASNGILVASFSSAWTITGNKFFQTGNRTSTASTASPFNIHRAINIITALGVNYTVSNNVIGYANTSGTGFTSYDGAFANRFLAIEMTVGIAAVSNVQGNIINGISLSTTNALASAPGIFSGISILAGNVNIGTSTGNIIGSTSGTGSISITSTTTGGYIAGIYAASTGTVSIQNNNIGSISTGGTALIGYAFYGINTGGTLGNFTIASNTIGSTTTANSIAIGSDTTSAISTFNGITNTSTGTTSVTGDTVQNCSVRGTGASVFNGLTNSGSTGTLTITTNNIISGTNTGTGNFTCISNAAPAVIIYIDSNIIRSHTRTAGSGAFVGISNTGAATSAINIIGNQLGNSSGGALTFTNASTGTLNGIFNSGGTASTLNINNNSLQGFSVVSSGIFTGISNSGVAGPAININNNQIGTSSGNAITYSAANTTGMVGISNTAGSATCALSIQSNDIRRIVHSVTGSGTHNYILNSAATLSQNISTNTFTNIDANTTGAITFISNSVIVPATGTQKVDGNSIVGTFSRNSSATLGALTLFNNTASSAGGAVISNSNNNFSNITVAGAATIAGWINTDGGSGSRTIQGNTFSNWAGGTGLITGMNAGTSGTVNATTGNNINNFTGAGNITAITTGSGNDNIYSNTISSISSTGAGSTLVNGIVVTGGTTKNIYKNTISGLKANFNNITGNVQNSLAVNGIWVSGGTTVNVDQNITSGFTGDAVDAGTVNGITVSGGNTVTVSRNKIYDLSSNSRAINSGGVSGILVCSVTGSVTTLVNNMIGDIRTPVSANSDALRALSINVTTVSNVNVYFNTVYLNTTSSVANFGCSGIYHLFNANPLVGQLDLRNNIIINVSTPTGTGSNVIFRQYGVALNNYASVSNSNLFYAGTPAPNRLIYNDGTNSDQTIAAFRARLSNNRDSLSFTEDLSTKILSFNGSSPYFLHIDSTKCTRVESGGVNISGIAMDYDGQTRQGAPGYIGTGSAPDLGADEIEGASTPRGILSGTATLCKGSSATLSLGVSGSGTISGTLSDGTAFSGTAPTITISVNPSTNTTYTISTLTNVTCTSNIGDKFGSPIISIAARPTGALSGTASMCNGGNTNLTIAATGTGTISGTLSDGTAFSGTAPTITVSVSPSNTTAYTISTLTNGTCSSIAADKTGSATVAVSIRPSASIAYSGSPFCYNIGTAEVTFTGTSGGTFSSNSQGASINSTTGKVNLAGSLPGRYTITYTVAASGGCSIYTTNAVIIISPNTWTGGISTDWNTAGNWVSNAVPTMSCTDVTILGGEPYQPTLGSGKFAIQNLFINSGAILTITNATLQIAGTINNSGTFDVSNGAIEINGSGTQAIPANAFSNNALKDLIISNSSNGGVVLGGTLDIYGSLTFTGTGGKLITNDVLTLKSSAIKTARVGDMTGNTITGKVTVERYISAHKAWRFLSVPTSSTQTVKQTWQEGADGNNSNPVAGYGAQITGAGGTAAGFDLYSATPSMKTYNSANNTWVGIANTTTATIKSTVGYMTFIRGDRAANAFASLPTQTVLRTKGDLYTGDQTPVAVSANKFASIGNPYASAVDMRKITRTGLKEFYYLWDPKLGGVNGLGAYQTFYLDESGNYEAVPGMGSYGTFGSANNYIESGQAFFVDGTEIDGSLTFKEDAKASGGPQVFARTESLQAQLRINLYGVNADSSTYMLDGVLNSYGDNYSNSVDDMDAIKSTNTGENLSVKRSNTLLVVERRQSITAQDTIFLNLTTVKVQKYRYEFIAAQLGQRGLTGFVVDNYLHTSTPLNLNGSTNVDFNIVNIPGAYAANRFYVVFTPSLVLPVTFTSVKAYQQNKDIAVEWKAENESNLKQYTVEKSVDGNHYSTAKTVAANNAAQSNYSWLDVNPSEGYNYYRILSTDTDGKTRHSTVVKVFIGKMKQAISVYPNPVTNGTINLQLTNQSAGEYGIRLLNSIGQVMISKQITHTEGSSTETIQIDKNSAHGIYQLEVTRPDATNISITVIY